MKTYTSLEEALRQHPGALWYEQQGPTEWRAWDKEDAVYPPAVTNNCPQSVTPWQIRKALNATGLRAAVEAAVAAGSQDMKDGWEFATEVRRDDPLVVAMGAALHKTPKELDELFQLAATL